MTDRWLSYLIFAVLSALCLIGFLYFPWINDDIVYRMPFRDYFLGDASYDFLKIPHEFAARILNDNARAATLAMYCLQWLPNWLLYSLTAIVMFLTMVMALKVAGHGRKGGVALASVLAAVYFLLLPWYDYLYVFDFQLPYIWGLALGLGFALLYFKGNTPAWLLIVGAFAVGMWQEAIGFPIMAGLFVVMVRNPRHRPWLTIGLIDILFMCLLLLFLTPGAMRYRGQGGLWRFPLVIDAPYYCGPYILGAVLLIAYAVTLVILEKRKSKRLQPIDTFLFVSAGVSYALMMYSNFAVRTGIWCFFASGLGLLRLLWPERVGLKSAIAGWILIATIAAHLAAVDVRCYRLGREYDRIIAEFCQQPDREIYFDDSLNTDLPIWLLGKPYVSFMSIFYHVWEISQFYMPGEEAIRALPNELKDFDPAKVTLLPGFDGYGYFGDFLIGPPIVEHPKIVEFNESPNADDRLLQAICTPFTGPDGQVRTYWCLRYSFHRSRLPRHIRGMYNLKYEI